MTFIDKIKSDLETIYLGKKIRCGFTGQPFTVKIIEVNDDYDDGIEFIFLDRVRDWPDPEYVIRPGQNTVTPEGDWIYHTPKDFHPNIFSGTDDLPEVVE
jgi:hypothetical protein